MAQKVGRREIYSPVPPPSRKFWHFLTHSCAHAQLISYSSGSPHPGVCVEIFNKLCNFLKPEKNKKKTLKVSKLTSCMNFRMIYLVVLYPVRSPRFTPGPR